MPALTWKPAASWRRGSNHHPSITILQQPAACVVAALARWYRVRRDTRHVMALSDHLLNDIGLDRSEVGVVVRLGRDLA